MINDNNYYVSCERAFDASLSGVPVVVASNNDGCAIARSAEAKALGVKMGDPIHLIRDRPDRHGVVVRSSNYTLYGDMQRRVVAAVEEFASEVEIYSIDETFLDLEPFADRISSTTPTRCATKCAAGRRSPRASASRRRRRLPSWRTPPPRRTRCSTASPTCAIRAAVLGAGPFHAYTKAGIMLDDLVAAELRPRTLFEGDVDRRDRLMTALDEVNGRFGRFTAVPAAQGFRREWRIRAENRSPAWTTRIEEVPIVQA